MNTNAPTEGLPGRRLLPLIVIGLVLLAVAIYLFSRPQGVPQLTVEPARIDLGPLPLGTPASFEIRLTNSGDGALRLLQVPYIEVLEGC